MGFNLFSLIHDDRVVLSVATYNEMKVFMFIYNDLNNVLQELNMLGEICFKMSRKEMPFL